MRSSHLCMAAMLLAMPATLLAQDYDEEPKHTDAHAAIAEAAEAMEASWNAHDWVAVAEVYTEDAIVMPPGVEAAQGREAIAALFEGIEGVNLDLQTEEVFAVEGAALEVGSWVMTADDGTHLDHGDYMAAWTRTDDGWKMARDMWNSNMGPPSAGN